MSFLRRTASNGAVVALGTAIGQGAVLAATPYLARVYTPSDFGALALLMTVTNIGVSLASLRFDLAIPGAERQDSKSLFFLCLTSSALTAFVAVTALYTGHSFGVLDAVPFSTPLLVGIAIFLAGFQQATTGLLLRQSEFRSLAVTRATQGVLFSALASFGRLGLLLAHVASFAVNIPYAIRSVRKELKVGASLRATAAKYRDFLLHGFPGAALDVIGYSLTAWIIASSYGISEAGQYSQVQRLIGAPLLVVSMSIGQVLLSQFAKLQPDDPSIGHLLRRLGMALGCIAVAILAGTWLVGEQLLGLVLGDQWRVELAFIFPICLAVVVRTCVSPLSAALISARKFKTALSWQVTYFVCAAIVLPLTASATSIEGFVWIYAIHEVTLYGLYALLILKTFRKN